MDSDELNKLLGEPLCNMCQAFIDDFVAANVDMRYSMGIRSVIIRQMMANCCDWCKGLAGVYDAKDVPKDIYRRHDNCKCLVTFRSEKDKYKDVWSKKEFAGYKDARIAKAVEYNIEDDIIKKKEVVISEPKLSQYLLNKRKKHFKEFFDIGYTENDSALLKRQITGLFDMAKAIETKPRNGAYRNFTIEMKLGVTKVIPFITVWRIDNSGDCPRLVTAHRVDLRKKNEK